MVVVGAKDNICVGCAYGINGSINPKGLGKDWGPTAQFTKLTIQKLRGHLYDEVPIRQ